MTKKKVIWTPARKRAFAEKMRKARAAAKKVGKTAYRAGRAAVKGFGAGASAAYRDIRAKNPKGRRRKRNPARGGFVRDSFLLMAKRGNTKLFYDGRHFTSKSRAHRFLTQLAAASIGRQLLRKFPVLKGYHLYVARV